MKKLFTLFFFAATLAGTTAFAQQDKSKRASPPAKASEMLNNGAVVTIDYSQPSLKSRTIGKDIAPFGKIWRTGANEATVFEVSKDVTIEGKSLPAGKYSLYTIPGEKEWTIIFNKTWNQWGTVYKEELDQLRIAVKPETTESLKEQLTFTVAKNGEVSMEWGKTEVEFEVK
ncbi:MAG: DUF2911 domain-containing protein [Sphingobacteriaceae bacterium]|nr:DUF2911 domain-containing protein [Sphingobacteriaceae bacterium]